MSTHTWGRQSHHPTRQPSRRRRPPATTRRRSAQEAVVQSVIETSSSYLWRCHRRPGQTVSRRSFNRSSKPAVATFGDATTVPGQAVGRRSFNRLSKLAVATFGDATTGPNQIDQEVPVDPRTDMGRGATGRPRLSASTASTCADRGLVQMDLTWDEVSRRATNYFQNHGGPKNEDDKRGDRCQEGGIARDRE
jgi:hypothetical protein